MATRNTCVVTYQGCNFFRQRLILATLSGKSLRINEIRSQDHEPGLREFEVNLIRLLDKITNGTRIEVSETGTSMFYQPGLLEGGTLEHACCVQRGIGYYLELLIALAPFCKKSLKITLTGATNNDEDPSVDLIKFGSFGVLQNFMSTGDTRELSLRILTRSMSPDNRGKVEFQCPNQRALKAVSVSDQGKIKRVRGVAYAVFVSPAMSNRLVSAAKKVLLQFIPDVFITTDLRTKKGGKSGTPGYGITLAASTTTGVVYTAETASKINTVTVADELGKEAAFKLLEEIYRGGCVDSMFQSQAALYMAMSPKDISKYKTGPLSQYTIHFLRNLREFFGVTFMLEKYDWDKDEEDLRLGANKVIMTCVGTGYVNYSRQTT